MPRQGEVKRGELIWGWDWLAGCTDGTDESEVESPSLGTLEKIDHRGQGQEHGRWMDGWMGMDDDDGSLGQADTLGVLQQDGEAR